MIGRLKGKLLEVQDDSVLVDVQGVGYEVYTTPNIISTLPEIGSDVSFIIYTDVRENAIVLFGFNNSSEKQIFLLLKKVKGIGSKLAITILSHVSPEIMMSAIGDSDINILTRVPGVGKKSAERIFVELREKVEEFVSEFTSGSKSGFGKYKSSNLSASSSTSAQNFSDSFSDLSITKEMIVIAEDATLAMIKLGFSEDKAINAVSLAIKNNETSNINAGELVKSSLIYTRQ